MNLDPRTLILITIIGTFLMSGGLFAVTRGYLGAIPELNRWAWATLLQALGWTIFGALHGVLPELVSILVGNCSVMLSLALYLRIIGSFTGRPVGSIWPYLIVLMQALLLLYFSLYQASLGARIAVNSLGAAILMLTSAYLLLTSGDRNYTAPAASHRFTAGIFTFCGAFLALRTMYYLFWFQDVQQQQLGLSLINDVSYLCFYVTAVLITFGFVLMCTERYIRQQKQAEQALQSNHALITKMAAQVPGTIYQFQMFADGRAAFPFATLGIQDIYEVSPEQVRENAEIVFSRIHPDDKEAVRAAIDASASSMQAWVQEYRVILPRQGLRWRLGQAQPERLADGSILWHGFISDITEQAMARAKQHELEQQVRLAYDALLLNEARLRKLMNSSLIGIVQGDASGQLQEANQVLLEMLGYPREALTQGKLNWFDLISIAGALSFKKSREELAQHSTSAPFETQMIAQDGSPIPVTLGLAQLEGAPHLWVAFVVDLRKQKQIDQIQSEFISMVSHELRTPLTSIRGSLGLLEAGIGGVLPPKALQLVEIAHKNSLRLASLVNDILDMEKLASEKLAMNLQSLDLVALAKSALEANASYAQALQVEYVLTQHPEYAYVMADSDRLMQVFANLLSNAAKFSHAQGRVELRINVVDQQIRVEVEDHGRGIPESFRQRIFGKFAQADGTDTRQLEGTGLGLHITKILIEKMGGEINFESEENLKTVFWFSLPSKQETEA
ncbi:PAS domain-containing sensor histidine kinase [Undibacterium sp. Ren11W]|uniref:PAS domain-containing sensor histidine kinase n=1 Tax=Undibacterium sp. Ren11W TaxID=3413045 RepID=UPI003BF1D300